MNHLRLFANMLTTQQQLLISVDSKLIAFCTILTVALSIMLSFKQSRCLLISATTTYPLHNVKKCIKCLRKFRVYRSSNSTSRRSDSNSNSNSTAEASTTTDTTSSPSASSSSSLYTFNSYLQGYAKYLKLKRLKTIESLIASQIKYTSSLPYHSCRFIYKQLLYKPAAYSLTTMRKTTAGWRKVVAAKMVGGDNGQRRHIFRVFNRKSAAAAAAAAAAKAEAEADAATTSGDDEHYCPACDTACKEAATAVCERDKKRTRIIKTIRSAPDFISNERAAQLNSDDDGYADNDDDDDDDDYDDDDDEGGKYGEYVKGMPRSRSHPNLHHQPSHKSKVYNSKVNQPATNGEQKQNKTKRAPISTLPAFFQGTKLDDNYLWHECVCVCVNITYVYFVSNCSTFSQFVFAFVSLDPTVQKVAIAHHFASMG